MSDAERALLLEVAKYIVRLETESATVMNVPAITAERMQRLIDEIEKAVP